MIILKNERDMEAMRAAGASPAQCWMKSRRGLCLAGRHEEIDSYAAASMKQHGARSAFLGYRKYPWAYLHLGQ